MILLIDNYDSFTYNLYQYFCELGAEVEVIRNDKITTDEILSRGYAGVVISPGPADPDQSGVSLPAVAACSGKLPLLGVCLGHQCIAQHFGGKIIRAPRPVHGKASVITHDQSPLFDGLPRHYNAGRYHSLVAEEASFPDVLNVTARSTDDGLIMALQHQSHPTFGVQFHPESILTEHGRPLLNNFLKAVTTFESEENA